MGAPYRSRAILTTSMARTTPAQKPRGFRRMIFFVLPLTGRKPVEVGASSSIPVRDIGESSSITSSCVFSVKENLTLDFREEYGRDSAPNCTFCGLSGKRPFVTEVQHSRKYPSHLRWRYPL